MNDDEEIERRHMVTPMPTEIQEKEPISFPWSKENLTDSEEKNAD